MSLKQRKQQDCERYLNEWSKQKAMLKELENNSLSTLSNVVEEIVVKKHESIKEKKLEYFALLDKIEKINATILHTEERMESNLIYYIVPLVAIIIASITTGWSHLGWVILSIIITAIAWFILHFWAESYMQNLRDKLRREVRSQAHKLQKEKEYLNEYQLDSKIELINQQSLNDFIEISNAIISTPMMFSFEDLQKEYKTITSKYYLEEFGNKKIDSDMSKSIEGNFPNTLGLSDSCRQKIKHFLSQISDQNLKIRTLEHSVLFKTNIKDAMKYVETVHRGI